MCKIIETDAVAIIGITVTCGVYHLGSNCLKLCQVAPTSFWATGILRALSDSIFFPFPPKETWLNRKICYMKNWEICYMANRKICYMANRKICYMANRKLCYMANRKICYMANRKICYRTNCKICYMANRKICSMAK